MAIITIQQTDIPSRSKQAGPCWVALHVPRKPDSDETKAEYASTGLATFDVPDNAVLRVSAKVTVHRATRVEERRRGWTVRATGNPADQVVCALGSPQSVEATLTGVIEVEPTIGNSPQ